MGDKPEKLAYLEIRTWENRVAAVGRGKAERPGKDVNNGFEIAMCSYIGKLIPARHPQSTLDKSGR